MAAEETVIAPSNEKSVASAKTVAVRSLQKFPDWTLVQDVETGECRVVGTALYGAYSILPTKFEMSSADWSKATRPVGIASRMGISGELGKEIDLGAWRQGRVRDDQEITPHMLNYIKGRIGRYLDQSIGKVQPKPEAE